jgi:hypothetical protein
MGEHSRPGRWLLEGQKCRVAIWCPSTCCQRPAAFSESSAFPYLCFKIVDLVREHQSRFIARVVALFKLSTHSVIVLCSCLQVKPDLHEPTTPLHAACDHTGGPAPPSCRSWRSLASGVLQVLHAHITLALLGARLAPRAQPVESTFQHLTSIATRKDWAEVEPAHPCAQPTT